jgi:hypothetical protein
VDGRQSSVIRQFCRLVSQPDAAIAYITKTVKPAKLDEKEAKQLIADLDSKDEAVWRAAARDLRTRDPRLAITFSEAWALAKTDLHRLRLGRTLFGYSAVGVDPSEQTVQLRASRRKGQKVEISFMGKVNGGISTGWSSEVFETFDDVTANRKKNNQRPSGDAVIACYALEQIGSPAAVKHLKALAEGHADAFVTIEATAALERMGKPPMESADLTQLWRLDLWKFCRTNIPTAFLDRPNEAVVFLKKNLRPVALTKESAEKLLARLLGDDKKEVRAALRELQVVDLALELNMVDGFKKLKTPAHRCRLAAALYSWQNVPYGDITDDFDIDARMKDYTVGTSYSSGPTESILWKKWREEAPGNGRRDDPEDRHDTLYKSKDEIHRDRWYHEESAIYILDAIGTDEAVAIIKDMATGHADAGPTKAAKEVLKRRGVK